MELWIGICSSLLSGLIGVAISTFYYRRFEKKKIKLEAFRRFVANRYDLKGDEFTRSLNEIYVVFNENKDVMNALSKFHQSIVQKNGDRNEKLVTLFKSMCNALEIEKSGFDEPFFMTPFNAKQ